MFFYEVNYTDFEIDYHCLLSSETEYSKDEFKNLCEEYFKEFPKQECYDKLTDKVYYTFDDYECLNHICDRLINEKGFNRVNVLHYYSNYQIK